MINKYNRLTHTKWLCKYHIVFTPKYRRKIEYNQYKRDIVNIIQRLYKYNGIFERKKFIDNIWYAFKLKYKYGNRKFWTEGYYVSTVGLNESTIRKYIREQESHDIAMDILTAKEYTNPFGNKKK